MLITAPMEFHKQQLHQMLDQLETDQTKARIHKLVSELDEETARRIVVRVAELRRRNKHNDQWVT